MTSMSTQISESRLTLGLDCVEPPRIWRFYDLGRDVDDRFVSAVDALDPPLALDLPEEFYLRELQEVDLNEDDSLVDFLARWGFLFGDYTFVQEMRRPIKPPFMAGGQAARYIWETSLLGDYATYALKKSGAIDDFMSRLGAIYQMKFPCELLDETRVAIAWLRDMARLWQGYQSDELSSPTEEWESSAFGIPKPRTQGSRIYAMSSGIRNALRPVTEHLLVIGPDTEEPPPPAPNWRHPPKTPRTWPPLYSVIATQLYMHMAENAAYKVCQNETCGRLFVRQVEGTAKLGQYHTEGVLYCSKRCAQVQAQREYRRRKKEVGTRSKGSKGDR